MFTYLLFTYSGFYVPCIPVTRMPGESYRRRVGVFLLCSRGTGIAQWLERLTRDWKVPGSNPCRSGGRMFFSRVDFLCWLLHLTYVALHEVTWCIVVWCTHNLRWDGCSFMWHQPCQRLSKYTTSVDIQKQNKRKTRYKKLVTHVEPQASAVSLLKRAENSAI